VKRKQNVAKGSLSSGFGFVLCADVDSLRSVTDSYGSEKFVLPEKINHLIFSKQNFSKLNAKELFLKSVFQLRNRL
jgi:hypothetical protein